MRWVLFLLVVAGTGFGAEVVSVRDGKWSEVGTWDGGKVPGEGDWVEVAAATRVVYDVVAEGVLPVLQVRGELVFARDVDTQLNVCALVVGGRAGRWDTGVSDVGHREHRLATGGRSRGRLEVGRPDAPIGAGVTARIVLHYVDGFDADEAPVVTCRPGARMDFYGAPMERTWAELGGDAEPGSKVVVLEQAVDGWKAGDEVIVTAGDRGAFEGDGGYRTEERTIVKVDGARVELDGALEYGHEGGGDFRCEVANLSRSVVIESANPIGVRGHTMFHLGSAGGMGYVRLADMGKRGVLGRYPVHFHQVKDSMRGASVVGLAVVNSHNRWVTVHGTEYMVVRDCVGYGSEGHGFFPGGRDGGLQRVGPQPGGAGV